MTGCFSGFAALFGLLDGGAFDFVLGAVEFGFELFTGFFELAHAFAEATGEHREFFAPKRIRTRMPMMSSSGVPRGPKPAMTGRVFMRIVILY